MSDTTLKPAGTSATGLADAFSETLRATILFAGLDSEQLDQIAATGSVRRLQRGMVLFEESAVSEEFYVVLSGCIAIARKSPEGRESFLALMGPGDLFGELGFLDGKGRSARARALEESSVLTLPYTALRALYENDPSALWGAVELLASRLRTMGGIFADGAFLDVTGRTAKRLLEMAGDGDEFDLAVTQEELAAMVGASRERVNKAIHTFVHLGWITQDQRHYKITNRKNLTIRAR